MTLAEQRAEMRADLRYRAYQRRWRVGGRVACSSPWADAYVRRMRVLDRPRRYEPPRITVVGNLRDLLERVN